jgi:hypothetical protein
MAQSGHWYGVAECPLLGVKRTSGTGTSMSAFDPYATSAAENCCHAKRPLNPIPPRADPCCNRPIGNIVGMIPNLWGGNATTRFHRLAWLHGRRMFGSLAACSTGPAKRCACSWRARGRIARRVLGGDIHQLSSRPRRMIAKKLRGHLSWRPLLIYVYFEDEAGRRSARPPLLLND